MSAAAAATTAAFNSRIRNAGDIERDSKIYGSFRSVNRFDLDEFDGQQRVKYGERRNSRHDDIFTPNVSLIQPVVEGDVNVHTNIAPLPPTSSKSSKLDAGKKRATKKSSSGESGKKPPRPRDNNEQTMESKRTTTSSSKNQDHVKTDQASDEEVIMETLRRRASRQRRRQREKENQEPLERPDNASLNETSSGYRESNKTGENNGLRLRSNSLIVKRAFEDPEPTTANDTNRAEVEVAAIQAKKPPTSRRPSVLNNTTYKAANNNNNNNNNHKQEVAREYFAPLVNTSTLEFVLMPAPQIDNIVHCKVVCHRGIFTDYSFYLDGILNKERDMLIMKATRRVTSTKSYYLISVVNYNKSGTPFTESTPCARVISNMSRSKFRLDLVNGLAEKMPSSELLNVVFKSEEGEPTKIRASACLSSSVLATAAAAATRASSDKITYFLKNRLPQFNEALGTYTLDYFGRARKSSKHNFQIVDESRVQADTAQDIIIQLGKQEAGVFSCDFTHPLCALQAFGFALSSLCR